MDEAAIQFEDPLSIQEKEERICPKCGVSFKLVGYKVDKMEIASWILAHSGQRGDETLNEEPEEETRLNIDEIPEQELHVYDALQPQSS